MSGWAGALGAAITGGVQGYQQGQEQQRQKEAFIAQQKIQALQMAIMNDQVNELPKKHAEADVDRQFAREGTLAYSDPNFVKNNAVAGQPLQTIDIQQTRNAELAKHGFDLPVLDENQLASHYGVAPKTGARIPLAARVAESELQRKDQMDQLQMQGMRDFMTGSNGGGYDMDATGQPANTARNRAREVFDPLKGITSRYGPAIDMPENAAAKARAVTAANAEIPPANLQRVAASMQETLDNLESAQAELRKLHPGIETNPDAYNGVTDSAKAAWHRAQYTYQHTPYEKAIQQASLANIQEWSALVPGRLNQAMLPAITNHQGDYGKGQTPQSTYQRNQGIIDMMRSNRASLLTPVRATGMQTPAAPQGDMGPAAPPAGQVNPADVAGQQTPVSLAPQPGETMQYSEIVKLTAGTDIDPRQLAGQLKQKGVHVLGLPGPAAPAAPPRPGAAAPAPPSTPGAMGLGKASSISARPEAPNWTMESFLRGIGVR